MPDNLIKKAYFTSLSRLLASAANFLSQMIITPWIITHLGQSLYGIFTLINKTEGYLSLVDLRPSAILRLKLSTLQHVSEISEKRKYVGAAIYISAICLPIIIFIGIIISFFFPIIFHISNEYIAISQTIVFLVALFLGLRSFLGIPEAILRGNNLEYKGYLIEPLRCFVYGLFVYFSLTNNYGLLGVVMSSFASFVFSFVLRFLLQLKYAPGHSPQKPDKKHMHEFKNKGGWYMGASFAYQLLQSVDIIIIGILYLPSFVACYALTRALSIRVSESLSLLFSSMSSGIGFLWGKKDLASLVNIKIRLLRYNIMTGLILLFYFLLFNESFVALWVGPENFMGQSANILICIMSPILILSIYSQSFIDSFLMFKYKLIVISIASIINIITSILLSFYWGILGIIAGGIISRSFVFLFFEKSIFKILNISVIGFLKSNANLVIIIIHYILMLYFYKNIIIESWIELIIHSTIYCVSAFLTVFLFILNKDEKKYIISKIKGQR